MTLLALSSDSGASEAIEGHSCQPPWIVYSTTLAPVQEPKLVSVTSGDCRSTVAPSHQSVATQNCTDGGSCAAMPVTATGG
jgi:hypothetical protein